MHAASVYLTEGDARQTEIPSKLDGELPAVESEATQYLDGHTVYHGTAADLVEEQAETVHVDGSGVTTSREATLRKRAVDFYADVSSDPGIIGVSSESKGEWFLKRAGAQLGVSVKKTRINVDAFAAHVREQTETADAWNVSRSRDYGGDKEETSIDYHDAADIEAAERGTTGLGFEYFWGDDYMRGILYESGYVALYKDCITEVFAKWLRDEVLPFLEVDRDEEEETTQSELSKDERDRAEVAATDGGEE
ncbi:hypothetical protein Hbl1158_10315 [Halobaculum sp. CBA1158]|uniref:hypothetical protein n=1 Tax=Halobaculum sp. CBA1158 TaxID=2904243 RepID=UPI001F37686A|nr:hypothetical protein [Halobaculum sp. CBA1158]UIO98928.1 hypothetical protein Hbl1158_10315 [Halobaculum sp. CBA1158]